MEQAGEKEKQQQKGRRRQELGDKKPLFLAMFPPFGELLMGNKSFSSRLLLLLTRLAQLLHHASMAVVVMEFIQHADGMQAQTLAALYNAGLEGLIPFHYASMGYKNSWRSRKHQLPAAFYSQQSQETNCARCFQWVTTDDDP